MNPIVYGVPFGRRSPRKRGPYSTPINNPSKVTDAARACLVSLRLISDSHPTEHTIAAYQVIDGGDDVEECHYKNNLPDICVD